LGSVKLLALESEPRFERRERVSLLMIKLNIS